MERPQRNSLALELTTACNQRCPHCYNPSRGDLEDVASTAARARVLALLDRALTEVAFHHVTVTGGEPLLYPGLFDVLDACRRHGLRAQLISNGSLVTDATAERLAAFGVLSVQLTLNGPDAGTHDLLVGRHGHFDRTTRAVVTLRSHGVPPVGCVVITRKNARLVGDVLARWHELGVVDVALSRFSPAGMATNAAAAFLCTRSELLEALDQAQAAAERLPLRLRLAMPVPPCIAEPSDYPKLRFGYCSIGTSVQEYVLDAQGNLRSCPLFPTPLGNANARSFADLVALPELAAYRQRVPQFCEPCPKRALCIGGCGAAAASLLGDARALDPFVAQHVDDAFSRQIQASRASSVAPVLDTTSGEPA